MVFDAFAGFDPDAFGSVSGCVRGGGLLVLLCPNLDAWPQYPDPQNRRIAVAPMAPEAVAGRYLARIARLIRQTPEIFLIAENSETRLPHLPPIGETGSVSVTDAHCLTHDQQMAVQALIHVVTGQRKKPVILTSDRGRGNPPPWASPPPACYMRDMDAFSSLAPDWMAWRLCSNGRNTCWRDAFGNGLASAIATAPSSFSLLTPYWKPTDRRTSCWWTRQLESPFPSWRDC